MKRLIAFVLMTGMAASTTCIAATALEALRVAQAEMPGARLVEISGTQGAPEPTEWTFAFADPTARGGVAELTVRRGAVISRRTPLRDTADIATRPAVLVHSVTVDSTQAFEAANRTAASRRIAFHSMDYVLRSNGETPVWSLTLHDADGFVAGTIDVAAANGRVVSATGGSGTGAEVADEQESAREGFRKRGVVGQTKRFFENTFNKIVGTGERIAEDVPRGAGAVADSVVNKTEATGRTIGKFFVGEEGMGNAGNAPQRHAGSDDPQPVYSPQSPQSPQRTNTNVVEE